MGETWESGSSPLTRGKHRFIAHAGNLVGLIPAHAGKTAPSRPGGESGEAHPRSRGENTSFAAAARARTGSSPLTRGKRRKNHRFLSTHRLIPAHAGKTNWAEKTAFVSWAHPRSRGEN